MKGWRIGLTAGVLLILGVAAVGLLEQTRAEEPGKQPPAAAREGEEGGSGKEGRAEQEQADEASAFPTDLEDRGFARYVDWRAVEKAFQANDLGAFADQALLLAEGERILLRHHRGIRARDLLDRVAQMAARKRDMPTLQRLEKAAQQRGDKEATEKLAGLLKLARVARATAPLPPLTVNELPEREADAAREVLGDLENIRMVGTARDATNLSGFVRALRTAEVLSEDTFKALLARTEAMKKEVPAEAKMKSDDLLIAKLKGGSRRIEGFLGQVIDRTVGQPEAPKPPPPPPVDKYSSSGRGPAFDSRSYYPIGDQRVRMSVGRVSCTFSQSRLAQEARKLADSRRNKQTALWDNKFYSTKLPENYSDYLLVVAHNPSNDYIAWMAIQNTSAKWIIMWSNGDISYPRDRQNDSRYYQAKFSGRKVILEVYNPVAEPSDIMYYRIGY